MSQYKERRSPVRRGLDQQEPGTSHPLGERRNEFKFLLFM
jgi:hypothetical protein